MQKCNFHLVWCIYLFTWHQHMAYEQEILRFSAGRNKFYRNHTAHGSGRFILFIFVQFFRTKPYACEPWSLPKYTPSKEMDAKLREDALRQALLNVEPVFLRKGSQKLRICFLQKKRKRKLRMCYLLFIASVQMFHKLKYHLLLSSSQH